MKNIEKVRRNVHEVISIECDRCKKIVEAEDCLSFQETLSLSLVGGFASVLGDGSHYELDFCQTCVKEVLGPFMRRTNE